MFFDAFVNGCYTIVRKYFGYLDFGQKIMSGEGVLCLTFGKRCAMLKITKWLFLEEKGRLFMYRIGLIGAGIIVVDHINAIEKTDVCQVVAVADINEEKAKSAAQRCGCAYFTDYKAIDVEMDAVIISLPHFLHCEATCYFLEKGIHVLLEKPMANTSEECERMIAAAKANNAKLAIGHVQRFVPANQALKKIYDEKTYGPLLMTSERRNIFYFADSRPRWFLFKAQAGGGIAMNYGAHAMDKLFSLMGEDVVDVHGNVGNQLNDYDIEGHAQFFVKFANGVSSTVTFSGCHSFASNETTYYFTDAAVRVDGGKILVAKDGNFEELEIEPGIGSFEQQLIEFVKLMEGKESMSPTGEYGAKIIRVIEQVYQEK